MENKLPKISRQLKERILRDAPQAFRRGLSLKHWKLVAEEVIFGTDTLWGRAFDVVLLWSILLSLVALMLESVPAIGDAYELELHTVEWGFTILFTIEYLLRIWVSQQARKYVFSFFGMVDLIAIIPTYLSLFVAGSQFLLVIRAIRLVRVFRVFKLVRYMSGAKLLIVSMKASKEKISVFLTAVLTMVVILGTLMYMIEGPENGFDSIPRSIYWAIVTLTTVGYGDISPHTTLGQFLAAFIMLLGYAIIAVPTGIVGTELAKATREENERICGRCGEREHFTEARYCQRCGERIDSPEE